MAVKPGQRWRRRPGGAQWLVYRVDQSGVLLQNQVDGEMLQVPDYEWPGDFRIVPERREGEDLTVQALLVGGEEGRWFNKLWDRAAEYDIELIAHWPGSSTRVPKSLPVDIELIVILVTHVGHSTYYAVKEMAKKEGVPYITVGSRTFRTDLAQAIEQQDLLGDGRYGGEDLPRRDPRYRGHYVWNGRTWVWRDPGHGPVESRDGLIAGLLALLGVVFARWR